MEDVVTNLVAVYLQVGFMAVFSLTVLGIVIWYLTKGRKEAAEEKAKKDKLYAERYAIEHEDRQAVAIEIARSGKIIENCTAVINNNSKVIEESYSIRQQELLRLENLLTAIGKQECALENIARNQLVYMERQKAEYNKQGGK